MGSGEWGLVVRFVSSEGLQESGFLGETRILTLTKKSKLMTWTTKGVGRSHWVAGVPPESRMWRWEVGGVEEERGDFFNS